MMRRTTHLGGLAILLAPGRVLGFWKKKARAPLPSGGTVTIPSGYLAVAPGKNYSRARRLSKPSLHRRRHQRV